MIRKAMQAQCAEAEKVRMLGIAAFVVGPQLWAGLEISAGQGKQGLAIMMLC